MSETVAGVRDALERWGEGDLDPLAERFSPDLVWHVPGVHRFAGEFHGRREVLDLMLRMAEAEIRTAFDEVHAVVGDEEHVVALIRATLHAPRGSVPMRSVFVLHFDAAGLVAEAWAMNDRQDEIDVVIGR